MSGWLLITLAVVVGVILFIISIYNKLIAMIESINNNNKQIDVQLDRRFKVFESLIEVVKKYMDYEKSTLKEVVALRTSAQQASQQGDEKGRIEAENKISSIASNINLFFEAYPDLKANENAMHLQEEIVSTENKLTFAKQAYNDSVEDYYATKKSFVESFIVKIFSAALDKTFEYWGLGEEEVKSKEEYTVKL